MNKKIIFISDFFLEEILGGAEKCDHALIKKLKNYFFVESIKSKNLTLEFLQNNKNNFFIITNFNFISENFRDYISNNIDYIIYEHDHKYLLNNNPIKFKDFIADSQFVINKNFFKKAKKIICQSKLHCEILYKNLLVDNIINAGGNFWTEEDLNILEKNISTSKNIKYASIFTNNPNKGINKSIEYCNKNNFKLDLIPALPYELFIKNLAKVENFIFFPQWIETYSRVSVEARILNCNIITNKFIGAASEEYFSLKGEELLRKLKENNEILLKKIIKIINNEYVENNFVPKKMPKISICTSVYSAEKYMKGFLENITNQTFFDKCELIIINANSPENEEKIILEYLQKFNNIIYKKLDYRATTTEAINLAIKEISSGEFLTIASVDDIKRIDCVEIQAKHLLFSKNIDLVYGDCLQTTTPNETFEKNSSNGKLYEHSEPSFSKENMIKCLPGPMPMWKKSMHSSYGYFDENLKYANDWDMWLRMVSGGANFKKIQEILGLYYFNENGISTSTKNFKDKIKEESYVFFKNIETLGKTNYNIYKDYFLQGIEHEK